MKRLVILLICFSVLVLPCSAAEESAENTATALTEAETEKAAEPVTKKITEPAVVSPKDTPVVAEEVKEDNSQPRLMVTSYKVENGFLTPHSNGIIKVTLKNTHLTKNVKNIKLSISDESDRIVPVEMGTKYVSLIKADGYYTWAIDVKVSHLAEVGEHKMTVTTEYEDSNGGSYSSSDTLRIEVRQVAELTYDGAILPVKVVQESTVTVDINLMNTGKMTLYNCRVEFEAPGLDDGGSSFVGEIPGGESKISSSNLRVDSEKTGRTEGIVKITYEDAFGEKFELTKDIESFIEKKAIKAQEQKEIKKDEHWWVFLITGVISGAGISLAIVKIVVDAKKRRQDEKFL